ncbi:RNA-binding protein [Methanogenium marinum]|uniref:RNA-binding protein n=1 Tax=Methanogenium marinum TaxID=348610 RepID=A0A9Q4PX80_9EURY|nr:RNA-binding protein [Methanogenium marinum]MDE4908306.1 RNA-binding protein [Methanogenium marinum]
MAKINSRKRHTIRKSDLSRLFRGLEEEIGPDTDLFRSSTVEVVDTTGDISLYLIEKKPFLMEYQEMVFPTIRGAIAHPFSARNIVVDAGAVRFMAKGADVMRPGIVRVSDDIREGHPVLITEETYGKPLAVGIAALDAAEINASETGKMVRTFHYVGDELWNLEI